MSPSPHPDLRPAAEKLPEFRQALEHFLERLRQDRTVLAAVLVGSLSEERLWRRDSIALWIIEQDGVSKRLRADGEDERIFRTLVEDGIDLHAELIPRSRFKRMVEGAARTAFSYNYFARRELVYCDDPSLQKWFETAQRDATLDRAKERFAVLCWLIHTVRAARRLLHRRELDLAFEELLWGAHALAAREVIDHGEVHEGLVIHRALQLAPERFQSVYVDLLAGGRDEAALGKALAVLDAELEALGPDDLEPLLRVLRKHPHPVPLSELNDHFAHTQLYPWHLHSACEWMVQTGRLEKLSHPFGLTRKSRVEVEEPAYLLEAPE